MLSVSVEVTRVKVSNCNNDKREDSGVDVSVNASVYINMCAANK